MTDTPQYIYQIQYDIIAAKPMSERVALGMQTIDSVRIMIKNSIVLANPNIDNATLEMLIFKRYYASDFSPELLNHIAQGIYDFHA
jgi:hypothetical protein